MDGIRDGAASLPTFLWRARVSRVFPSRTPRRWRASARPAQKHAAARTADSDPRYFRPTEVEFLLGDPAKAKKELGWVHTTGFKELVADMMESDLASTERKKGRAE